MTKPSYSTIGAELGISKQAVAKCVKRGMPVDSVDAARAWRLANNDFARSAENKIDRAQAPAQTELLKPGADGGLTTTAGGEVNSPFASSETDEPVDENTAAYRGDRARNERIKADRAEIELQQLRGELVPLREAEQLQFTALRITRDRVQQVAPRIAADLQALAVSLMPEAQRDAFAKTLPVHEFEQRLDAALRTALNDAATAIEEARRDDDDPDT